MDEVQEVVEMATSNSGGQNLILTLIIVLVAVVFVAENIQKLRNMFGYKSGCQIREEQQTKEIKDLKTDFDDIKTEVDHIKEVQSSIKEMIHKLDQNLTYMQEKQDATDRARIKDRISQAYRYYKDKGQWTSMEQEAFNDLVNSYEQSGGLNSFIHEVVVPASLTWKIVDQ